MSDRKHRSPSPSSSSTATGSDSEEDLQEQQQRKQQADADDKPAQDTSTEPSKAPEDGANAATAKAKLTSASMMMKDQPLGRTGGVYIPPFKLAKLQKRYAQMDKATPEYQRLTWEALRKGINGLINKVNVANIKEIVPELFQENLVRGKGLFARAIMKAQLASPGFTHIYAALVAVINTKLPENGELVLRRVIFQFRRSLDRRDKVVATACAKFIAHLVNHQVAHELLALQLIYVLLSEPTDDSVEMAVNFTKEVGFLLNELAPTALKGIFDRFRGILREGDIDKRVQYTIEGLFAIWKTNFEDYKPVPPELDIISSEDKITFTLSLEDKVDKEERLDVFHFDPQYEENEKFWQEIKKEILGEDDEDDDDEDDEDDEQAAEQEPANQNQTIIDMSESELIALRRTIYLTIMSSAGFEECTHKLLNLNIPEAHTVEVSNLIVECCSQEKSYIRYYGLIGQRLCMLRKIWQDNFDDAFSSQYSTIHRLETNKLRNVAKLFAHLLCTDALPWTCLEYIQLNEEATTSSSRIFIKVLMLELSEGLGLAKLRERFSDAYMQDVFAGLFPRDNPRHTRFAINFFTQIGLGGLTDGLREHLKNAPKLMMRKMQEAALRREEEGSSSSSSSDSSSSGSSSDSSSDSSSESDSNSDSSSDSDSDSSSGSSSSSDSSSSDSEPVAATKAKKNGAVKPVNRADEYGRERGRDLPRESNKQTDSDRQDADRYSRKRERDRSSDDHRRQTDRSDRRRETNSPKRRRSRS